MTESTSRAVMCVVSATGGDRQQAAPAGQGRPDPRFLVHLLAVRTQCPEQRAKRRAAPEVGAAAYRGCLDLEQPVPAPALRLDRSA